MPGFNIEFTVAKVGDGYFTPRHRHNFDQIRYVLSGDLNIGKRDLKQGECGYFSEGVYYGPQAQQGVAEVLTLQLPGASGTHFMTYDELNETHQMLKLRGADFKRGIYTGKTNTGQTEQKDGYEALWEAHEEQELIYPQPRYEDVVIMQPSAYRWIAAPAQPGVETKHLGVFTELQTGMGFLRLNSGSRLTGYQPAAPHIYYLLSGAVVHNGQTYPTGSAFFLPAKQPNGDFQPTGPTAAEFFTINLPMISYYARQGFE